MISELSSAKKLFPKAKDGSLNANLKKMFEDFIPTNNAIYGNNSTTSRQINIDFVNDSNPIAFNSNGCEVLANNGKDVILSVESFLSKQEKKIKDTILALFKWFISEYIDGYYANKDQYSKDNKSIIEHFGKVFFYDGAIENFRKSRFAAMESDNILLNLNYQGLVDKLVAHLKKQYDRYDNYHY